MEKTRCCSLYKFDNWRTYIAKSRLALIYRRSNAKAKPKKNRRFEFLLLTHALTQPLTQSLLHPIRSLDLHQNTVYLAWLQKKPGTNELSFIKIVTVRLLQPRPPGKSFRKLTDSVRGMKQQISHKIRASSTIKFKTTFIPFKL